MVGLSDFWTPVESIGLLKPEKPGPAKPKQRHHGVSAYNGPQG